MQLFPSFARGLRWLSASVALAVVAGCATQNAPQVGVRVPGSSVTVTRGISVPDTIWDRVRSGFSMPDLYNPTVRDKEAYYTNRPDYVQRMVGRSNKYLYHVIEELERRRMPTELGLLPFIESAFNPHAVSSAKAAGMWQFIPSTGRDYSLTQNTFRDERRDVVRSTRAALDYLQRLYAMFGDWHLALAAYNWGEGNVQRAIARNQAAGLGTRYEDLTMPAETREYVPKLQAIKNIVRSPSTFSTTLPDVANRPYFEKVAISRDMDVAIAAQLAGISVDDFKALNPAANRSLIIASVTPHILLPYDSVSVFKQNLNAMGDRRLASWTVWVPSETVTVAQASKQTGATEEQLRDINRIPVRMKIKAGSTILVPRAHGQEAEIPSSIANSSVGLSLAPEVEPRPVQHVVLRRSSVRAGKNDTVASIAARYGLSPATVAQWNQVKPGQKLAPGKTVVLHLPQAQAGRGRTGESERVRLGKNGKKQAVDSRTDGKSDKVMAGNKKKKDGREKHGEALVVTKHGKLRSADSQTSKDKRIAERGKSHLGPVAGKQAVKEKKAAAGRGSVSSKEVKPAPKKKK